MSFLTQLSDERLLEYIDRLHRDIRDFEDRARLQKAALEREGRFSASAPLYQRLTSIHDRLRADLKRAEGELERRRTRSVRSKSHAVPRSFVDWRKRLRRAHQELSYAST